MRLKFSLKFGLGVVFFASIPWLPHRSEEKSTDPAKIQWRYDEDPMMRWKFSFKSGLEVVFLASISWLSHRSEKKNQQIWRRYTKDFARSGEDLVISGEDSAKIWRLKLTPTSIDPTVVHWSPIRLDPRFSAICGRSFNFSPDVSGSVSGWAQTRPGPTHGHPYNIIRIFSIG